jgi:peroxiredoxin Q/BCP
VLAQGQKLNTRFTLKVLRGGLAAEVMFADLLTRPTLVSVHMRNNTPGCDRQVEALALVAAEFDRAGFNVIGLSRDTCGSHRRKAAAKGIDFVLASDPDDRFAHAADAIVEKSMYGRTFRGPARSAWLIDRDGTVLAVLDKIMPSDHATQFRTLIKSV